MLASTRYIFCMSNPIETPVVPIKLDICKKSKCRSRLYILCNNIFKYKYEILMIIKLSIQKYDFIDIN